MGSEPVRSTRQPSTPAPASAIKTRITLTASLLLTLPGSQSHALPANAKTVSAAIASSPNTLRYHRRIARSAMSAPLWVTEVGASSFGAEEVQAWGLEILCANPTEYSNSLTAVLLPAGHDADRVRQLILERFDMSLGTGLGKLASKVFRIGHLGDFNDLALMGTLAGVEMGLTLARVPVKREGVRAAMEYLSDCAKAPARRAA